MIIEAMKQALEALEQWNTPLYKRGIVIQSLRRAIAEAEKQVSYSGNGTAARGEQMKPKFTVILDQCITTALHVGWERAHKHTETPTKEQILDRIEMAIWEQFDEFFDMEAENE
jgi:hypothetical protein